MVLQVSPRGIKEGEKNGFCLGSCPCTHTLNKGILRTGSSKSQEEIFKGKIKSSDWIAMLPLPMSFLEHFGMKMFLLLVLGVCWVVLYWFVGFFCGEKKWQESGWNIFPLVAPGSGGDGATTGREERGSCVPSLMCHHISVASVVIHRQHPLDVQSVRREKRVKCMEAHLICVAWSMLANYPTGQHSDGMPLGKKLCSECICCGIEIRVTHLIRGSVKDCMSPWWQFSSVGREARKAQNCC